MPPWWMNQLRGGTRCKPQGRYEWQFPSGNISSEIIVSALIFPDQEILVDNLPGLMIFSRSVNIMSKRILTPADIGDLVKTARKAAGLRQDELAGAAGVGLRFIVDLEAGKPTAQIGKVLQVLAALGCTIDITSPPDRRGARMP